MPRAGSRDSGRLFDFGRLCPENIGTRNHNRLTFANPEQGLSGSASVTITAGGVAKITSCW